MKHLLLIIFFVLFLLTNSNPALAQFQFRVQQQQGQGIAVSSGGSAEGIVQTIIVNVISLFFAVGGIGVLIYFIWGAVDWILSGGDKEKVANARKKMSHAIIGLFVLSLSFAIIRVAGSIAGFDPLGSLQLRGLGDGGSPTPPNR